MPDDTNHDTAAQQPSYELDVSREISTDFLQEAHGALYQARVKQLAIDFNRLQRRRIRPLHNLRVRPGLGLARNKSS